MCPVWVVGSEHGTLGSGICFCFCFCFVLFWKRFGIADGVIGGLVLGFICFLHK